MTGVLFGLAVVNALIVAVITWAVARRYGTRPAFLVPIGGVIAIGVVTWQNAGPHPQDTMGLIAVALMIAWPWALGAVIGLIAARWRRR